MIRRAKIRAERGYTLIEIMIALFIFMIALLGLVALQRASIRGGVFAREQTAAVSVARFFLAQLQNEAAGWPLDPPGTSTPLAPPAEAPMLSLAWINLSDADATNNAAWLRLPGNETTEVGGTFRVNNFLMHTGSDTLAPYCINYRIVPVPEASLRGPVYRAHVRVVWPKGKQYTTDLGGEWTSCTASDIDTKRLPDTGVRAEVVELVGLITREFAGI